MKVVGSEDVHTYITHNVKAVTSSRLTLHQEPMSCATSTENP